jgi:diguanylate cyclase (GGDEF)-like protein
VRSPRSRSNAGTIIAGCALLLLCACGHDSPQTSSWVYVTLLIAGLSTGLTGLAFLKFYTLSRGLQAEIRARRALEDELKKLAITDPGTEVMNRRGLFQAIEAALASTTAPLSLLIIDLDHFKRVNDTYGHACGDHVLLDFARVCREIVRAGDAVGRLGGEEFAIVLPGTKADEARRIAECIRETVKQRIIALPRGGTIDVTVSIGLAVHRQDEALEALMSRADGAMYEAKCLGRNRVVVAADVNQTARLELLRKKTRRQSRHSGLRATH